MWGSEGIAPRMFNLGTAAGPPHTLAALLSGEEPPVAVG